MSTAACMAMKLRNRKPELPYSWDEMLFDAGNGETVGMPFSDMQMEVTGKVAKNK